MEKPFALIVEDRHAGRYRTESEADLAGRKSGGMWFEVIDLEARIIALKVQLPDR